VPGGVHESELDMHPEPHRWGSKVGLLGWPAGLVHGGWGVAPGAPRVFTRPRYCVVTSCSALLIITRTINSAIRSRRSPPGSPRHSCHSHTVVGIAASTLGQHQPWQRQRQQRGRQQLVERGGGDGLHAWVRITAQQVVVDQLARIITLWRPSRKPGHTQALDAIRCR
jgi:hypothetical protein